MEEEPQVDLKCPVCRFAVSAKQPMCLECGTDRPSGGWASHDTKRRRGFSWIRFLLVALVVAVYMHFQARSATFRNAVSGYRPDSAFSVFVNIGVPLAVALLFGFRERSDPSSTPAPGGERRDPTSRGLNQADYKRFRQLAWKHDAVNGPRRKLP